MIGRRLTQLTSGRSRVLPARAKLASVAAYERKEYRPSNEPQVLRFVCGTFDEAKHTYCR